MRLLAVFGTRPEAIKLAPVLKKLIQDPFFDLRICVTGQHKEMLDSVLQTFGIKPHYDLEVMKTRQGLGDLTSSILLGLKEKVFKHFIPDGVLVHGDTTTTFSAALAGFYEKIPVYHVEAGLRTGDLSAPWPEEGNRVLVSVLAEKHFAPTKKAREFLLIEGVSSEKILVTGNTVIDSLFYVVDFLKKNTERKEELEKKFSFLNPDKKLVLVTGHRRESFGDGFLGICNSLKTLSKRDDIQIVYPVHLNPNVRGPVLSSLSELENVYLVDPLDYIPFVYLMQRSYLILTDSGGIQEEAPSLGIPVLVMRDVTERPEAVEAGTVILVGTQEEKIVSEVNSLFDCSDYYRKMSLAHNPYGDGFSSSRIVKELKRMEFQKKQLCILGLGYIGLPTAALFSNEGLPVLGVDINESVLNKISSGGSHIAEPGLGEMVNISVKKGLLKVGPEPKPSDYYIVAVPTPIKEDKSPDDSYVMSAIRSIAPVLGKGNLVVIESTSPVGTTEKAIQLLMELRPDLSFPEEGRDDEDVHVVYCPERVIPGKALEEMRENDRIIGCNNDKAYEKACSLYRIVVKGACVRAPVRAAEMSKLTENAFRDVNIAFANELEKICDKQGINCFELIRLANRHPRVNILQPGPGVGGHCIPVDPWFIVSQNKDEARLMKQARLINDAKPLELVKKVKEACQLFKNPRVAILGLSFKADIDDFRESPALDIAENLVGQKSWSFSVVEPFLSELPDSLRQSHVEKKGLEEALQSSDVILLLVDHASFKECVFSPGENQILIDTKGVWQEFSSFDSFPKSSFISKNSSSLSQDQVSL